MRYKHPHIDRYALVSRVIDSTFHTGELQTPELLAHVVYSLRCIHAGMVVHDLIADTGSGGKVQAYIAVFPATHCNNQWLTVIGFAHFRCQPQTGRLLYVLNPSVSPKLHITLSSILFNVSLSITPTKFPSRALSTVRICSNNTTEYCGKPCIQTGT